MSSPVGKIYISSSLMRKLGIPLQTKITVRVGCLAVPSELVIVNNERSSYLLSPALARALYVKKRKALRIRYDRDHNHIHLGPTVGILSTFLSNRADVDPTSVQAELIFLSNISRSMPGQVFVFTPAGINWSQCTTRGYVYRQGGGWVSATYPLPDVVYDRVSSRTIEARDTVRETKKRLQAMPFLKYFNPSFLNKWKVHQMLWSNPELRPYLPETRPLSTENLRDLLQEYRVVFVKPANGSLGKGIIKITRTEKGGLKYVIYRRGRVGGTADNAEEFMHKTRKERGDRVYIVQQGLDLATYRGRPFDVRIVYQKNGKGEWQIGKKFVRVAPHGSSISNLSSGGHAETSKKVFRYLFQKNNLINQKNNQLKQLCLTIANTLERATGGNFGELGLDIGIGKDGHPYLIEVNSKPRKTTETELSIMIMRNTFKRPLEYSVFLAGFHS